MKLRPTDIVVASAWALAFESREQLRASIRFGLSTAYMTSATEPSQTAMVLGTAVERWPDYHNQQTLAVAKVLTMDGHVLWMAAAALKLVARRKQ